MKQSARNLMVIENFILHATHCSENDHNANEELEFTANKLYRMANDYIAEDHADGVEADTDELKLVYDKPNARVILEDDSDVAFYTDNHFDDTVVETVVDMYNTGKTLNDMRLYLFEVECSEMAKIEIISGISLMVGKYK